MYSAKADFLKRIPSSKLVALTQGTGTTVNDTNLEEAIAVADEIIDSYLMSAADEDDLPLASPPRYIKEYSVVIALKNMQKAIQYKDIPEWVQKEYEAAIKHLSDISAGKANIKLASTVTRNDEVRFDDTAPTIFTRGSY